VTLAIVLTLGAPAGSLPTGTGATLTERLTGQLRRAGA
jgi:hypothetical protein